MAQISFALYEAHSNGVSPEMLSETLDLPVEFVCERIEAARLSLLILQSGRQSERT